MDFGRISKNDGLIQFDQWVKEIEVNANLEQVQDRVGTNPFTEEKVLFSRQGRAYYIENGEKLGNIEHDEGVLLTTGVPVTFCNSLAKKLGAVATIDDRS